MPILADRQGNSVLHFNISTKQAQLCINAGDDINFKNNLGFTPLYLACKNKNFELVKFYIKNGAYKLNVCWDTTDEIKSYLIQIG
jgi:ankyrin repeat protein